MADLPPSDTPAWRPTRLGRAIAWTVFGALMVAFGGMIASPLLVSPLGAHIGLGAGVLGGALAAWEARPGGALSSENPALHDRVRRSALLRWPWLRMPLFALFGGVCVAGAVSDAGLGALTAVMGAPASRTLTVFSTSYSSRGCSHFDVREVSWVLDRALCASDEDLARARPGDQLIVYGKASAFGLNVERYELRRAS